MSGQNTQMARRPQQAEIVRTKQGLQALLNDPQMQSSIAQVLPRHITPERVVKMALVAASRQPKLLSCTKESICKAIITASELGLDCSGTLGSGYIIPYGNEATFIPGYRGLIDLARRSGQISNIQAHVVYKQDFFEFELGTDMKLVHKPHIAADRDETKAAIVCAYAIAELTDGTRQIEVMTISQIEGIRKRSKAGNSGPWVTDFAEMARKTVVRRLCKYLPLSPELEKALQIDNENDGLIDVTHKAATTQTAPAGSTAQRVLDRITQPAQEQEPEPDPEDEPPIVEPEDINPSDGDEPAGKKPDPAPAPEAVPVADAPPAAEPTAFCPISDLKNIADGAIVSTQGRVKTAKPSLGGKDKQTPIVDAMLYDGPYEVRVSAWGSMPEWLVQGSEVYVRALERKGKFFNVLEWEPVIA